MNYIDLAVVLTSVFEARDLNDTRWSEVVELLVGYGLRS